jgi:Tfp pilus tip-associated adhesin PilY1
MRIVPISEVFGLGSGETVPAVKGTVASVFDQNKGTNAHGDWKLQNIIVRDGTGEIKVKLADRDPIPGNWRGRVVCIECNDGGKGLTASRPRTTIPRQGQSDSERTGSAHLTLVDQATGTQQAAQTPPQTNQAPQSPRLSLGARQRRLSPPSRPARRAATAAERSRYTGGNAVGAGLLPGDVGCADHAPGWDKEHRTLL